MALFIVNNVLAVIWMGLTGTLTVTQFCIGLVLGFGALHIFRGVFGNTRYTQRGVAFFIFVTYFIKAFVIANISVIYIILFRSIQSLEPNIIVFSVRDLSEIEVMLLAHSITLTPGTTTIDYADGQLTVHALDAPDPQAVRESIDQELLKPLLGFTR
ncbi:Na+/H+ antiporter subunit E [bacterium]|mgnify:CR=1 FL=1|jgi:multisubunit Na+/H+ antiporter MnhE subunit|nr:Na+/H+ antiporter subunit E [bacterium]